MLHILLEFQLTELSATADIASISAKTLNPVNGAEISCFHRDVKLTNSMKNIQWRLCHRNLLDFFSPKSMFERAIFDYYCWMQNTVLNNDDVIVWCENMDIVNEAIVHSFKNKIGVTTPFFCLANREIDDSVLAHELEVKYVG